MTQPLQEGGTSARVVWLDVVRLVAMFTVVCCHSADPFNFYPGPEPDNIADIQFWGAAYGAALRPCVPLFVMLTGALLLPVRGEAGPFYRKRIGRVVWPFLLWSVIYNLFPWLTGVVGCSPRVILDFFPYAGEEAMQQSLGYALKNIARIPLNFTSLAAHMWYIYLLVGLYLYLPVFSAWVEKASRRAQGWFLAAWAVTLFVPYFRAYVDPYLWGACSWNEFYMLYAFAGFNGYLLLGHYLRHTEWSLRRTLAVGVPMFVAGFLVTFFGFRHITSLPEYTPEQLELFFYYCSPNVVMMTVPLFMLARHVRVEREWVRRLLANLTACGFGIYMVHYFFTGPCVILARWLGVPVCLQIPAGALVAFAAAWTVVELLRRLLGRRARYVVG